MSQVQRKLVVTADTSSLARGAGEVQRFGQSVNSTSAVLEKAKASLDPAAYKEFARSLQPAIQAEKEMGQVARQLERDMQPMVQQLRKQQVEIDKATTATQKRVLSETRAAEALRQRYDTAYRDAVRYSGVEEQVERQIGKRNLTVEQGNAILAGAASRWKQAAGANDNFRQGIVQSDQALDRFRSSIGLTDERLERMQTGFASMAATFGRYRLAAAGAAGAVGLGGGFALSGIIETASEFQRLEASLKTVTGSADNAQRALAFIQQFSTETPYTLQEVTESFIRLQALGLDPSRRALEAYGNTASAMGKPMMQFIEAVADATTGEMERLKEFGIRAAKDGDEIAFTFQGTTEIVKNSAEEIEGYLRDIGQTEFAGAMAEQMEILPGVFGNAQDAIANFQNGIGEGGLSGAVQRTTEDFTGFLNANSELASSIGGFLGGAIDTYTAAIRGVGIAYSEAYQWTQAIIEVVGGLVGSFSGAGAQIAGVGQGFVSTAEAVASGWHASGRIIYEMLNRVIGAGVGAYQSIVTTWDQLPAAFASLAKKAGNALIDGLQFAVTGAVEGLNTVLSAVGITTIPAPDLSQFKAEFTDVKVTVGDTIASIMSAAQGVDYLGAGFAAGTAPIKRAIDAIAAAKQRIEETAAASRNLGEQSILTGEDFKIAVPAADGAAAAIGGVGDEANRTAAALKSAKDAMFSEADGAVERFFPMDAAQAEADRLRAIIDDTGNGLSDLQRRALGLQIDQNFRDAIQPATGFRQSVRSVNDELIDMGDIGRDVIGGVFDAFANGEDVLDSVMGSLAPVNGLIGDMSRLFQENEQ